MIAKLASFQCLKENKLMINYEYNQCHPHAKLKSLVSSLHNSEHAGILVFDPGSTISCAPRKVPTHYFLFKMNNQDDICQNGRKQHTDWILSSV